MKQKLQKHWTTRETALQRSNTAFFRDADKLTRALSKRFQASQNPLKTRNYNEGQLVMNQRSTNFNVSESAGSQEASS
ncbi:unnamed protein product [Schistosoma mattheei]|uniref:Uncharacterized protein n=1 Tax=Schistosoma mattheei TaxID=31246 RepID=A0A183NYK7_9TREM|nr:unnamed protein product [Schistosoma mattheei]